MCVIDGSFANFVADVSFGVMEMIELRIDSAGARYGGIFECANSLSAMSMIAAVVVEVGEEFDRCINRALSKENNTRTEQSTCFCPCNFQ